jgi:hypothetical protein
MTKKFLFLYRTPLATEQHQPSEQGQPSPEQMQAMLAQWHRWKEAFPSILDMGDGLLPTGRSVKADVVTDGPSAESKEIISGYSIVAAADYDAALVIARACPVLFAPGASIEVRELAGYLSRYMSEENQAIDLVLRHEYGRLVAALLREFGAHRLSLVEDGLSQAMLEGVMAWRTRGVPPSARARGCTGQRGTASSTSCGASAGWSRWMSTERRPATRGRPPSRGCPTTSTTTSCARSLPARSHRSRWPPSSSLRCGRCAASRPARSPAAW